jgi:hypothetical protein
LRDPARPARPAISLDDLETVALARKALDVHGPGAAPLLQESGGQFFVAGRRFPAGYRRTLSSFAAKPLAACDTAEH